MPWQPLPRIAFAVATYPFAASGSADLPLEIGDELYVIEETPDGKWLRGYLVAPPSLLAGLTSVKGQTLEARVFSGIFPRSCVEVREMLGEADDGDERTSNGVSGAPGTLPASDSAKSGLADELENKKVATGQRTTTPNTRRKPFRELPNGTTGNLSIPVKRDPNQPRPPAPVPMLKIGDENPTSSSEPLIDEISSCLREWHSKNLHELLLSRQYAKLDELSQLITSLNHNRQQFLYNVLTAHEFDLLREKTVWDLVRVNKLCGGEVIVRDPEARGRVLTGDDSVVEVTQLQSVMTLLDEPPQPVSEFSSSHHLLLDVKGFAGASSEATSLVFYLVSKPGFDRPQSLSECFTVDLPPGGAIGGLMQGIRTKTLFSDLTSQDIGDLPSTQSELYLVVKVLASQQLMSGKPLSRSGTATQTSYAKDTAKPVSSSGNKSSRRSLMWSSKGPRTATSRGSTMNKMDSLAEMDYDEKINGLGSRDGQRPPSTADSRNGAAPDLTSTAQRTVGMGILKLNAIMKQEDDVEQVVSIWSKAQRPAAEKEHTDEMDALIRDLMDSSTGHYERSRRGERLQVQLRAFNHPDPDALIKATPTILSDVRKTSRMGFSGAPTKPRSDIYITLNSAALARQNLLSRYGGSATSLPSSLTGSNLQVTLEVRRSSGERIENCIYTSSNTDAVTTFKSTVAERGHAWNQTLRLALSPTDVSTAHIVMYLSDLPQPPFAMAYMPLWDQQAFIRDGTHGLLLYRIDENTSSAKAGPTGKGGYLSTPWAPRGRDEYSAEVTGPLALLRVSSYLCSTRFSQDRVLLGLLKWRELPRSDIPAMLKQLIFVPEIEVVKLLSDVLDGLFGILVEFSGNDDYEDLVFTALVRVLDIVHDRRFNLGPVVDQYAERKFNSPYATPCLIRSFTRLLINPTDPATARKLRATFKVVRHILKFITHSRGQQKLKEAGIGITSSTQSFSRQLRTIFKLLDEMMRNSAPMLVGSQTLAVQHFHTWLPELTGLLDIEEILHIAIDFMDSCTDVKGKLVLYKLVLIINYSKLDLFAEPEQKAALTANTVRWIKPHWGYAEEVSDQWRAQIRLCCSVLASQIDQLGHEIPDHIPKIIDSYLAILESPQQPRNKLSLLFPTSYPFPSKPLETEIVFDEALAELSAVLSAVSSSSAGMQLELADEDLTTLLENLLRVHMSILTGEAFPTEWLSVHIYHHKSTMRTLDYLAGILLDSFMPEPDEAESFKTEMWKLFFTTLLKLVGSSSLALETFPEQKRRAVWKIAGDVRELGADLLRRTWEAIGWDTTNEEWNRYGLAKLGGYQVQYVPTLVGQIVELCLSVHEGLRKMAVEVLQTMIVSEWTLSEDLSVIQTEMIDCLDDLFKSKPLTESILQKLFVGELLDRFEPLSEIPDEPLYEAVRELVGTVDEFLDLLVAVYSGEGGSEASHIINRLRLMEFLRDMQKEEIFIRYVDQLANLQAEGGNHAEAGLALRLHADLYDWDPTRQTPALSEPDFPAQTMFERKEKIYFDMISHFEDGESWSNALTAYKELRHQYETNTFDFPKLARTERAIATIYETISKSDKLVPRYFKVIFKGLGFPAAMQDKEFIYEGSPTERASAFTDRMQEQFPSAQIVANSEIDEVEGQFLVVSAVTPHRDLSQQVYQRAKVPQVIRDFLVSSHPQSFSVTTKRVTTGPVEEHYAEKTLLTTAEPFPTILRRSEIIDVQEIRLTAHETALERIVRKTQEMTALERRLAEGDEDVAQLLLDAVSVSVNPNSESSVACYRKLLPQPKETEGSDEEEEEELVEEDDDEPTLEPRDMAIKMALLDHAMMIRRCLALFSRSSNEILATKEEELRMYYESTFEPEVAIFAPPPPPLQASRDVVVTPSSTWRGSSPSTEQSPLRRPNIATAINGVSAEEASVIRPVSVRQRSARLSFLGGKKKSEDLSQEPAQLNGFTESASSTNNHSRKASQDHASTTNRSNSQRRGHKLSNSSDHARRPSSGAVHSHGSTTSSYPEPRLRPGTNGSSVTIQGGGGDRQEVYERDNLQGSPVKRGGSVRKRLSMLKLGKKPSRGGLMGSLDEE